jgi:hypothetical protein
LLGFDALPDPGPDAVLAWLGEHATPGMLVELLELLVRERQLTRRSANRLMEGLLARVDAKGAWK